MASINSELLEALLQGEEDTTLDHKSEQYRFISATDTEKSELLKDVLAMANAWKTSDAHIVVGARENPGGRAVVQGLAEHDHIDDAKLQQFVNEKTNVELAFSYQVASVDGKKIGVFTIAKDQHRPIWIKKDFGHLRKEAVYLRRGSSTTIADPDEIARMGEMRARQLQPVSLLQIGIGDPSNPSDPGTLFEVVSIVWIEPPPPPPLPSALRRHVDIMERVVIKPMSFDPSPKQLFEWRRERDIYRPVCVHVRNVGQLVASDVRVEMTVRKAAGLLLCDEDSLPEKPQGTMARLVLPRFQSPAPDTYVTNYADHWVVALRMGKVQPGGTSWSDPFFLGSSSSMLVDVEARVLADEISAPPKISLSLRIVAKDEIYQEPEKENDD